MALLMPMTADRGDGHGLFTADESFKIARPWFRKTFEEAKLLRDAAIAQRQQDYPTINK